VREAVALRRGLRRRRVRSGGESVRAILGVGIEAVKGVFSVDARRMVDLNVRCQEVFLEIWFAGFLYDEADEGGEQWSDVPG
jgi:hypothetical protein